VFEGEPKVHPDLLTNAQRRADAAHRQRHGAHAPRHGDLAADNLIGFLGRNRRPLTPLNPEVVEEVIARQ
jgi:hypothetical protein